jgi:hypothetical protein
MPANGWSSRRSQATWPATTRPSRPGRAGSGCRRATPRCWPTPTVPTTRRRWPWPWALWAARALLADGGSVLVADERVADAFTAPGDATERLMYGWSILHCLPATLAEDHVEANGTVLRAPTLARWAAAAGFPDVEVLAIDNPFWRFYRLRG